MYRILFLLAGALFYEKIGTSVALFWFGWRDVRVSSNILLTSRNQRTIVDFPAFWRLVLRKRFRFVYITRVPNKKKD